MEECKKLLGKVWNSIVIYGPRNCNKVVDKLARMGYDLALNTFKWVDVIPPSLLEAL